MKAKILILLFIPAVILLCGCGQMAAYSPEPVDTPSVPASSPVEASATPAVSTAATVEPMDTPAATPISSGELLKTDDLMEISLSAPEGSGAIRILTIRYCQDGVERYDTIGEVSRIDLEGYDEEKKEQTFTVSDGDRDGIVELIVYREFWFPDIDVVHAEVPLWPTVYEYDLASGFIVASAKHKDYFKTYAKDSKEQLSEGKAYMSDAALLALSRLVYAAERVADGSFIPQSPYANQRYEDVYELTKGIVEF